MKRNVLFKMMWGCGLCPAKPQYGNYYLRGMNGRYRKTLIKKA